MPAMLGLASSEMLKDSRTIDGVCNFRLVLNFGFDRTEFVFDRAATWLSGLTMC